MKTRIISTILMLTAWFFLVALLRPAAVLATNTAAVATAQNSDTAFYAQRSMESISRFPFLLVGSLAIICLNWISLVIKPKMP